jgi:tetratricopeptide (TPR) repeat protein
LRSTQPRPEAPPPRPSIFFGRQGLLHEVLDLLLSHERSHVVLIGPGGIGKTSIAKAIVNDPVIEAKFKGRRFFVRFDDLLASQITYNIFVECIARTLGVAVSASGSHREISDFLRSGDILIVLDNAETFLDCKATEEIPRINRAITEFGDYPSVTILITSRIRQLPHDFVYKLRGVPPLDKGPAIESFTKVYQQNISQSLSIIERILDSVAYHPLSINLLAHAGEENQWSVEELLAHWGIQHTRLISTGYGKDDNLGKSVELSLSSPSVKGLGDDVRGVLDIIAFFPQGVLREKVKELFPTVNGIAEIINILLKQSLLLCNNGFVTMLAPIRLYLCDACPQLDLLPTVREYYYGQLSLDRSAVVAREDVNVESLIAYDLSSLSGDDELKTVVNACEAFIYALCDGTCRSTSLRPVIDGLDTSLSPIRKRLKLRCVTALSILANGQNDFANALQLNQLQYNLAVELGLKETAFEAIRWSAVYYGILGRYYTAQTVLDQAVASPDWATANEESRAHVVLIRAFIKQCNDIQLTGPGLAKMFDESRRLSEATGDVSCTDLAIAAGNLSSGLIAGDWTSARSGLEASIATILKTDPSRPSLCFFFDYLAAVAFVEGNMDEARQLLNNAQRHYVLSSRFGKAQRVLLTQAIIMLAEGKFEEAREHVRKVMKGATSLGQAVPQLHWLSGYISGLIELISGQLSEARQLFEKTKQFAESQDEFHFRAFCTRALGEVAFLENDLLRARAHFEDTRLICASAGIVPELLYRSALHLFYNKPLPDTCGGWTLFLENRFSVV